MSKFFKNLFKSSSSSSAASSPAQTNTAAKPAAASAPAKKETAPAKKMSTAADKVKVLVELTEARRTIYNFEPKLPAGVTEADIKSIVESFVKHTPTSFNIQNIRAIILFGDANKKLWSDVYEATKEYPFSARPKSLEETSYGTIVFFDDQDVIDEITKKFEAYKDNFPVWAAHSNGSAQIEIWKSLSALGLGANLQHFNPFVEAALKDKLAGKNWNVVAQLSFGLPTEAAGEKTFIDNPIAEYH